jgi:hypothetical protein
MRGDDDQQEGMFSYISPDKRVPADHPLGPIRKMVDEILKEMSPKFQKLYSDVGRPSIERLYIDNFNSGIISSACLFHSELQVHIVLPLQAYRCLYPLEL